MRKLLINSSLLLLAAVSFTSCLKEAAMNMDPDQTNNVIEFANTGDNVADAGSEYPRYATDLGVINIGDVLTININISYSGPENEAPEDITVNLALADDATVDNFNDENGTNYVKPPTSLYSFPSSLVIKKGTHRIQGTITLTINDDYDFNDAYALPIAISSTSMGIISGNFGTAFYSFGARNKYDGIYSMDGTMTDVTNASLTGWYPINMQLRTYTANSVALYDGINYVSTYGHPIRSGSNGSYYGTFSPVFYFDETTGDITDVKNYYGDNAGSLLRSAEMDPTGVNKIYFNTDGSVASFEVSYILTQSGTPRTYFTETFTYVEPR